MLAELVKRERAEGRTEEVAVIRGVEEVFKTYEGSEAGSESLI